MEGNGPNDCADAPGNAVTVARLKMSKALLFLAQTRPAARAISEGEGRCDACL